MSFARSMSRQQDKGIDFAYTPNATVQTPEGEVLFVGGVWRARRGGAEALGKSKVDARKALLQAERIGPPNAGG